MPAATIHILHTNDFHNALTDEGAARLRNALTDLNGERDGGSSVLLLDAGDAIRAGNVGVNPWGEPILERMSDVGYHAMTLGNREFHVLAGVLETKINRARFPVLCANIRPRREETPVPLEPWRRFVVDGVRVVVFGLTVPMVTERMRLAPVSAFVFDDPVETAARLLPELRPDADLVVALTHIGLREDERLARAQGGIDLIIGGHSHVSLPAPRLVNNTHIVQAGWHGHRYGHVTITLGTNTPPHIEGALHPLENKRR